jgi:hypothetical protein
MAIGGSTNAVIHLIAIAGRLGMALPLERFDELSRQTPWLVNLKPSGKYQMEELFDAGGIPAVMKELAPLLRPEALTVTGTTVGERLAHYRPTWRRDVIAPLAEPLGKEGGTVVLRGNLCPDGAVLKQSAASSALLVHRGRAVVFCSIPDMRARIDAPDLDVTADDVLVLQNAGPVGAPGMPEVGFMPIPAKLLRQGVRDMVRLSDARMSGTSYGTIVLHVAPESAIGGPLALVQDGDMIALDLPSRRLTLEVPDDELTRRRTLWQRAPLQFEPATADSTNSTCCKLPKAATSIFYASRQGNCSVAKTLANGCLSMVGVRSLPSCCTICGAVPLARQGGAVVTADVRPVDLAPAAARRMAEAASRFLGTLSSEQRAVAQFPFAGDERYVWNYTPVDREGLRLKEMTPGQRAAALALFDSGLSVRGAKEAQQIIALEPILREAEQLAGVTNTWHRDPERYAFSVFGEPGGDAPWGWRAGGHHIGVHFTVAGGELVAPTPLFFGTNPAEVRHGPETGLRVLAAEEGLARALLRSLAPAQRAIAVVDPVAPRDILTKK